MAEQETTAPDLNESSSSAQADTNVAAAAADEEDQVKEAPAVARFDSVQRASIGRAAVNRTSCKNSTRRKSTLRQSREGKRVSGNLSRKSKQKQPSSLAPQKGAKRYFSENAGLVEVLDALMVPDDGSDTDGLLRCMLALERLVEADPANGQKLSEHDQGLGIVVTMVGRYGDIDNVVSTGCWILSNVAVDEESARAVCQANGDRLALEVMSRTKTTEMILHAAVALLCNIALHESLRDDLVDNNALHHTLGALDAYPNHEWIQYTSIQMLQNFANTAPLCEKMLKQNALQRVVKAMHFFSDHEELLQSCNWILSCVAFSTSDEDREKLQADYNVISVILQGMADSPDHVGVQFTGCSAFANLARCDPLVELIAQANIVTTCAKCMRAHSTHDGLQMVACRCMVLVAASQHAQRQFRLEECLMLCEGVLNRFPETNAAVEAAEAKRLYTMRSCCTIM